MHSYNNVVPDGSNWNKKTLSDKVKTLREYVYRIECVSGGSFVEENGYAVNYPEVDAPYKTKSLSCAILLTKVSRKSNETVLEFSSKSLDGCWLSPKTILQCGREKLQLRKIVGIPSKKDEGIEIPEDWQVRTFKTYFPPVPSNIDKVDFIEPNEGSGTPFVWKGIHLK